MKLKTIGTLTGAALALTTTLAFGADQADLIKPVDKELTFIFVPKVVHPWYDVVQAGGKFAVEELAKDGIKVNMIWDQPPKADVADQNARIEADIGRQPDGLAVACLDKATNVELLKESVKAGIPTVTFNSFCDDAFPLSVRRAPSRTAPTSPNSSPSASAARATSLSSPAASRPLTTCSASPASRRSSKSIRISRLSSNSPTTMCSKLQ